MAEKLVRWQCLDRRRLEEAFLLFAVLKIHFSYDLELDHFDFDRNMIVEKVVEVFLEKFLEKWSGTCIVLFLNKYEGLERVVS